MEEIFFTCGGSVGDLSYLPELLYNANLWLKAMLCQASTCTQVG